VTQPDHQVLFLVLKLLQVTAAFCTPGVAVGNIAFLVLPAAGGASFGERIATDLTNLNFMQPTKEKSAWTTVGIMVGSDTMGFFADLALTTNGTASIIITISRFHAASTKVKSETLDIPAFRVLNYEPHIVPCSDRTPGQSEYRIAAYPGPPPNI
jgi:hypothetical protein